MYYLPFNNLEVIHVISNDKKTQLDMEGLSEDKAKMTTNIVFLLRVAAISSGKY